MNTYHSPLFRTLMCFCIGLSIWLQPKSASSEIRNGYGNIEAMRCSLASLKIVAEHAGEGKKCAYRRLDARIAALEEEIIHFQLTEVLLAQFRDIAADLYAEIDSIRDRQGRSVLVYVKFAPCYSTLVNAWGITYMAQDSADHDTYVSQFGKHSVLVTVWTVQNALQVLAHELGHVSHQVPHLAEYIQYHRQNYGTNGDSQTTGHGPQDPSGISALTFERRFQKLFSIYNSKRPEKYKNPRALLEEIKRNTDQQRMLLSMNPGVDDSPVAIAYQWRPTSK